MLRLNCLLKAIRELYRRPSLFLAEDQGVSPLPKLRGDRSTTGVLALGRFSRCEAPVGIPSWSVEEVLRNRLGDLGIPIVSGLPFGHDGENAALPVGSLVELDGDRGTLSL